jgi:hypothetical protein
MINLEELKLYLQIRRYDSTYIDGVQLYDQILIYMTRLNKFTFSIDTTICNEDVILELQSNEDIQRSFIGRGYQQVVSYVHTISMNTEGKCHFYSLPYEFEYFHIEYCFQGGMFHKVRYLNIDDTIPFEHELFQLISQEFPFLEFLYISHDEPQEDKQHSSTLITFPHLKLLDLKWAHVDYAEQLLLKKNAHLPRLLNLCIEDKSLITITNNFTTDPTHFNFGTLTNLDVCQPLARFIRQCEPFVRPENFLTYFPLL